MRHLAHCARCRRDRRAPSRSLRSSTTAAQPPQLPRPTFETKAEIVLVDVNVVDRDAKPVPTLTAGRLRARGQRTAAQDRIDPVHLHGGDERHAGHAARSGVHLERKRNDRTPAAVRRRRRQPARRREPHHPAHRAVAVQSSGARRSGRRWRACPTGFGGVEFTADRKRITDGLMRVTGAASSRIGMMHINISEAWALESNDAGTFQNAVEPRMRRHDRPRSRCLPQPARGRRRGRCCSKPAAAPARRCNRSKRCSRTSRRSRCRSTS